MKSFITALLALPLLFVSPANAKSAYNKERNKIDKDDDYGKPLFLTPYIESGNVGKARDLSRTGPLPNAPEVLSYSGFITVKKKYNSNIFFWFVPALNKDARAPVMLWLQGGPGDSGLFGFFVEHGPYVIRANMTAALREYSWTKAFQVIYVDNPVGTGFSFTNDDKGYVTNQKEMAEDLIEFLKQFFKVFDEYKKNDFYVFGEAYGGKYAVSLAYWLHAMSTPVVKLLGVGVGNGLCLDPESQLDYGSFLLGVGLVGERQADRMQNLSAQIRDDVRAGRYYDALLGLNSLVINFQALPHAQTLFQNFTGLGSLDNLLQSSQPADFGYFEEYLRLAGVRRAAHLGNTTYQEGARAQRALLADVMWGVRDEMAVIMDNYRVLVFSGQLGLFVPYPLTVAFVRRVAWKGASEYAAADRHPWTLPGGRLAGYVHQVPNLHEVLVRDAGHKVPYDQPEVAYDMIHRFLKKKSFS